MDNNTLYSNELEQMRSQIEVLKQKLEKQEIIKDTHIRNSMKSKMSDLNKTILATVIAGAFAAVYAPFYFYGQGCSSIFVAATAIMLIGCLALTIVQKINLGKIDLSQTNLVEAAGKLSTLRKHYKEWYKIAIPMLIVWCGWMFYEFVSTVGLDSPHAIGFCCGAAAGLIIGGLIGSRINRKIIKHADEILSQIDELQQCC